MKNLWKFSLLALVSALVLTACPTPTPTPPPPPGPPAPPPPPATITVAGTVVTSSGAPVSGVSVQLNNAGTPATTGASGQFGFSNVTTPYTLTAKTGSTIVEYRGLSRADPQIDSSGSAGAVYGTTAAGNITGPTFALPAGDTLMVSANGGALGSISGNTTTGAYTGTINWGGGPNKTTDLVALRTSGTVPTLAYLQTGKRTGVTLQSTIGQSGLNIPLDTTVPSGTTTFNYTLGAYTTSPSAQLLAVRVNGASFSPSGGNLASGTSVSVPTEGSLFGIGARDASNNRVAYYVPGVSGGVTNVTFPSTVVLKNSLPSDGSTGVSKLPTFTWSPVVGADLYFFTLSGPGVNVRMFLPGNLTSLTLPDYTALGGTLAASTSYNWGISSFQNASFPPNVLTDPVGANIELVLINSTTPILTYRSNTTSFTTAP